MSLFGRKLSLSSTRPNSDAHKHTYCIYESRSVSPIKRSLYFTINKQNGDLRIKKSLDKSNFGAQTNLKYMNNIKNINILIKSVEYFESDTNKNKNNNNKNKNINKLRESVRLIIQFNNTLNIGNKKTKKGKYWDILFQTQFIRNECIKLLNRISIKLNTIKLIVKKEKMRRPFLTWISDDKVQKCQICDDNFNAVNRRHHCRSCGKVLCQKCSSHTAVLPDLGIRDIVRVCDTCYKYIILNRMKSNGLLSIDELYCIDYAYDNIDIYIDDTIAIDDDDDNDDDDDDTDTNEYYYGINKHWRKFIAHNYCKRLDPFNDELKELIRKGIPSVIRGYIWRNMVSFNNLQNLQIQNINLEEKACAENDHDIDHDTITLEKDLERTFPIHSTYKNLKSINLLKNILINYSYRNNKIGYCQSMNFLGAIVLLFLNEMDGFCMLSYLIEKICCLFDEYYYHQTDIVGVKIDGFVLNDIIKEYLPNLYKHLLNININSNSNGCDNKHLIHNLTFHWFLNLFINTLSFKPLLIMWDNMICYDSINIIFRGALSILKIKTHQLLKCKQFHQVHDILANKNILKDDKIQNKNIFIKTCYLNEFKDIENFILKQRIFHKNKLNDDYIGSVLYYNNIEINLISNYSNLNDYNSNKRFISLNTPRRSLSNIEIKSDKTCQTAKNLNNYYFQDDNDSMNYDLFESSPCPSVRLKNSTRMDMHSKSVDDDMITYNNGFDAEFEFESELLISKSFHRDLKNNDNMVMVASPTQKTLFDDYIHISTDNNN